MHRPEECGSFSDWLWCGMCDTEYAEHRQKKGETCVHCLFLLTKSWRAGRTTDLPMFVDGKLSRAYSLQGDRREATGGLARQVERTIEQDNPAKQARDRPGAEAKAQCLAIQDRPRSPSYSRERQRGPLTSGQPRGARRRAEYEREDSEEAKDSLTEAEN